MWKLTDQFREAQESSDSHDQFIDRSLHKRLRLQITAPQFEESFRKKEHAVISKQNPFKSISCCDATFPSISRIKNWTEDTVLVILLKLWMRDIEKIYLDIFET